MTTPTPSPLDAETIATLMTISTATITTVLLKKGLRSIWMRGPKPLRAGQPRQVGRAFTLRFVPTREDVATPASWSSPRSTRAAVESMPAGSIVVADAMGITSAGIFGDILCARMVQRGVAALITDGVVRDVSGVNATGLPVWCQGTAAPASVAGMTFVNWEETIGCGGVAVFPGDIIVADDDGAVLIPDAYLAEVLEAGPPQERLEAWIMEEVGRGATLPGLYPPNAEALARYEASQKPA
ncbi:MAG: dimethylmenaquinone methyltransferase [Rhizobacter sp.]|nr:dimethylmenaquinone methyltransferase [Rhizobacter sp.]